MPKQPTDLSSNEITPNPNLEKRTRRSFTPEYKLDIVLRAQRCKRGELGELLREEGLYSAQLQQWRNIYEQEGVEGLSKTQPGPPPKKSAEQRKIEQLTRQIERLKKELNTANGCIELQKKVLVMHENLQNDDTDLT